SIVLNNLEASQSAITLLLNLRALFALPDFHLFSVIYAALRCSEIYPSEDSTSQHNNKFPLPCSCAIHWAGRCWPFTNRRPGVTPVTDETERSPRRNRSQIVSTSSRGRRPVPFNAHSQTTSTRQRAAAKSRNARVSLIRLPAIFADQNSERVAGSLKRGQSWPCQKQPCTRMTVR